MSEKKCHFTTCIGDWITCSKTGKFDFHGFSLDECEDYPCEKIRKMWKRQKQNAALKQNNKNG